MNASTTIRSLCAALLLATTCAVPAIQVTYQVDMSIQTTLGNFNPSTDTVFVSGTLSSPADWLDDAADGATNYVLTPSAGDANIYEGTFEIDQTTGQFENHKFVINPNGDFTALQWEESIDNRFFEVPATNFTLDVVFFDDVSTLPSTRDVTFRVDLSVQRALGNFDPQNDFVQVAGSFNSWSTTASELTQSLADTNVWEGTFAVTGLTGNTSPYKFVLATFASGDVWEADGVGPGGLQNRELVLPAGNTNLPVVFFSNVESIPPSVPVTFQVDMAAQVAYGNYVDGVNTVTAAGEFNNWDAVGFVLTNNPGGPYVYQGTITVVAPEGADVAFQYVIDGVDWETAVGNRTFTQSTNSQTVPAVFWNNVGDLGEVTTTPAGGNLVDVEWTPGTLIRLQKSIGLPGWTDVPGSTGQSNATVEVTTDETYFRLIGP
jgi:hypothetical protein